MRAAVTAVQPAVAVTWTHEHSVVVVEPQPRPEQFDEIGQYARVVDEFFDRVPQGMSDILRPCSAPPYG